MNGSTFLKIDSTQALLAERDAEIEKKKAELANVAAALERVTQQRHEACGEVAALIKRVAMRDLEISQLLAIIEAVPEAKSIASVQIERKPRVGDRIIVEPDGQNLEIIDIIGDRIIASENGYASDKFFAGLFESVNTSWRYADEEKRNA